MLVCVVGGLLMLVVVCKLLLSGFLDMVGLGDGDSLMLIVLLLVYCEVEVLVCILCIGSVNCSEDDL